MPNIDDFPSSQADSSADPNGSERGPAAFITTRWSLVRAAGQEPGSVGRRALGTLCESYWYLLYVYVRSRGYDRHAAQDVTQSLFAYLLQRNVLAVADQQRGRFRFFLLQSLKNFLSAERRRAFAQKRGGGSLTFVLDFELAEERFRHEPVDATTPERLFERLWALTLLDQALAELRSDYAQRGQQTLFSVLEATLQQSPDAKSYAELGDRLGMAEGAVKVAVHRMRRRYRDILRR